MNKLESAQRCIAAYDAADPSDRNAAGATARAVALKTVLSECFHELTRLKPDLQLGSREKAIFSLDNNPKRMSVLKHVRTARPDIPVDDFIMKHSMPAMIAERTKEDNKRTAAILQKGKFEINNTAAFYNKMHDLARKLVSKEIVNVKLAKLVMNFNCALRINESEEGSRTHVPTRTDFCVDGHMLIFRGGSKVKGLDLGLPSGETRPAYAKLTLFEDNLTNGLLDIVFDKPEQVELIDKMNIAEFEMLMQQFGISPFINTLAVPRFLPSHFRSLGARFIELLFDNDVAVNPAGSILHVTRRCLGHKSCETTQRYIAIKCHGELPEKIGCVSHVEAADLTDGGFVVKLYDSQRKKRKRRGKRGGRKNRGNKRQCKG